jgi:hypothetical protein
MTQSGHLPANQLRASVGGPSISHDVSPPQHGGSIDVDTQPGEFTSGRSAAYGCDHRKFSWTSVTVFAMSVFDSPLVNRAIYWAVARGISTCCLMIAGFGSAYFGFRHEPGAAILFTLSLGLFTFSLISFAREVKVAMSQTEFG